MIATKDTYLTFPAHVHSLPQPARFSVRVEKGVNTRCPSLRLAHEPLTVAKVPQFKQPRVDLRKWSEGFVEELRQHVELLASASASEAERTSLRFAVTEIATLADTWPEELPQLLFAGYLALAEQMCRGQDDAQSGLYMLASRALERNFES